MDEKTAIAYATQARMRLQMPVDFILVSARRSIIELVDDGLQDIQALPGPGLVRDKIAWLVTFGAGAEAMELAIDDGTGEVVRVQRSSGAISPPAETEAIP